MLRQIAACVTLAATAWLVGCADKTNSSPEDGNVTADVSGVVEGGNHFTFDLYQRLQDEKGNLFFSPASISLALAMTYAGADGITEAEMSRTLHFQMPKSQLHDGMAALQASWHTTEKKQGFRLHVANRLWGQQSYTFLAEFLGVTRNQYGAELARLDFVKEAEKARQTINGWVEDQTEKKITNLIPSADVLRDARLVLTNAVYFKGDWSAPFDKGDTREKDFHVASSQTIKAPLMLKRDDFQYAATDGVQILELPYGDKSLSMLVVLPEKVDGLSDVEAKLTVDNLRKWSEAMRSQDVVVYLPKFKTTFELELKDTLRSMGITSAFDAQSADFSGMTGGKDLFISAVIHKAFVDVNEEGTEAAAATGVGMVKSEAPMREPPVFRADRPFVFLIRDNRNGAILFLGRVVDPTK